MSTIRRAILSDLSAVQTCAEAAYAPYIERIGRKPAPMIADFAAQIADGIVYVAEDAESRFEGYAVFYPRGDAMRLENVAVRDDRRGRGVGRRLIAYCEAAARDAGRAAVELYTNAKMTENLSLYPALGYDAVDRRHEDGFDRVYFRKPLV